MFLFWKPPKDIKQEETKQAPSQQPEPKLANDASAPGFKSKIMGFFSRNNSDQKPMIGLTQSKTYDQISTHQPLVSEEEKIEEAAENDEDKGG